MSPYAPLPQPEECKDREFELAHRRIQIVNSATRGNVKEAMELLFLITTRDYSKPLPDMKRVGPLD